MLKKTPQTQRQKTTTKKKPKKNNDERKQHTKKKPQSQTQNSAFTFGYSHHRTVQVFHPNQPFHSPHPKAAERRRPPRPDPAAGGDAGGDNGHKEGEEKKKKKSAFRPVITPFHPGAGVSRPEACLPTCLGRRGAEVAGAVGAPVGAGRGAGRGGGPDFPGKDKLYGKLAPPG